MPPFATPPATATWATLDLSGHTFTTSLRDPSHPRRGIAA
jgi:hypothetical protein